MGCASAGVGVQGVVGVQVCVRVRVRVQVETGCALEAATSCGRPGPGIRNSGLMGQVETPESHPHRSSVTCATEMEENEVILGFCRIIFLARVV